MVVMQRNITLSTTGLGRGVARQRGMVLIISLLFMLIMMLAALSVMQGSTMQEKMTGNNRDRQLAFQAAESALRAGETYLGGGSLGTFADSDGLYTQGTLPRDVTATGLSWRSLDSTPAGAVAAPQYLIESFIRPDQTQSLSLAADEAVEPEILYRVSAKGFGSTERSQILLQSIYRR